MKRLTTLAFAALIALTLSAPAWSQANQGKTATTQTKEQKKEAAKAKKQAAKNKKQPSKDAKKNEKSK